MIAPFILAVDFMNFTYATNPCAKNVPVPVVMRKGEFTYYDKKMVVDFTVHVDSVVDGSLANGTRQAVVVLSCDFPEGGTAGAYLYDVHANSATLLGKVGEANWGDDWGAGPDSITLRFADERLNVRYCANDDCTATTSVQYALRSGKLVKLSSRTPN
jgi:hypothetical protein